jgi:LPS export ABC transporter protein LptC
MTSWQRRARLVLAVGAVLFAVVVFFSLKRRTGTAETAPAARTDPGAVVEITGGRIERFKLSREDVRVAYDRQLTYANGSTKLVGVTISADQRLGGRSFTVTANDADVGQNESTLQLNGDVRLSASDGMTARTQQATYSDKDGIVRAAGPVDFSRGRMSGSGIGMTHDAAREILTILDRAVVHVAADEKGAGGVEITSGSAAFARVDKNIRFERDVKLQRDRQTIEGDTAVLQLTDDETQVRQVEVRGRSRIAMGQPAAGGLQDLSARDMDLHYAGDGQTLERAVLMGDAAIVVAGDAGAPGRQIKASTIDITLGPDGATPTGLVARDAVTLTLPAEGSVPERTIRSAAMDGKGEPGRGLTQSQFTGNVEFRERAAGLDRVARSGLLDVALAPGMAGITDATFTKGVRFFEDASAGDLADDRCVAGRSPRFRMCAASIRYDLGKGQLGLTGSEPGSVRPRVVNNRIAIDAIRIDVALAGPDVKAAGDVKSVMQVARDAANGTGGAAADATRLPAMFKQDRPVNVTAEGLDYDGSSNRAVYTGNAQLWQDDTSVKGPVITLDDKTGDLTAAGGVTTVTVRDKVDANKKPQRIRSIATSDDFRYEESSHRATYTGKAHMNSPDGDMTANRIELYLKPGSGGANGNELERAEAYEDVTLRDKNRTTTGARLTYTTVDERYVVTGTPVKIIDECRRETIGRTLTYLKSADTVTIDGNEQTRTQTRGSGQCP